MNLSSCLNRKDIWQGCKKLTSSSSIKTGFKDLDEYLPSKGWPIGMAIEILVEDLSCAPLWLISPALKTIAPNKSWQAFINPPENLYPPGLHQIGLDISKILVISPTNWNDAIWSTEQSLYSQDCSAVITWPIKLNLTASRKLQLASENSDALSVYFYNHNHLNTHSMNSLRISCRDSKYGTIITLLKNYTGKSSQGVIIKTGSIFK